ncbi:cellular tumor antigen p53-like isoform X2 [Oscarella lobularis]|uniref:cellular tumor antigen p53-like isoform X2 n=1 Tax=Oscarella lobularis TaxID=121494 RepID=UPI0033141540
MDVPDDLSSEPTAIEIVQNHPEGITDLFGSFPLDFGGPDSFPECAVAPEDPQIEENSASGGSSSISASSTTRFVFSETSLPKSRRPHYSQQLNTVFVKEEQDCAFTIALGNNVETPASVIVCAVYVSDDDCHNQVARCKAHFHSDGYDDISSGRYHFFLSRDSSVIYYQEKNRLYINVPYSSGNETENGKTFTFQFMCRQTCCTPLKQRPIKLVFLLAGPSGNFISELSVGLKVSSCPFRDKGIAEEKLQHSSETSSKKRKKSSSGSTARLTGDFSVSSMSVVGQATREKLEDYRFCAELAEFVKQRYPCIIDEFKQFRMQVTSETD